jgi:hypothetical protein
MSRRGRRKARYRSNLPAGIAVGALVLMLVSIVGLVYVRHERHMRYRGDEWFALPWDPRWPPLPSEPSGVPAGIARSIYAFAGAKPEVLRSIPCYCGCKSEGHRSHHDCFVRHRSPDGTVAEWNRHGLVCPLASDITGHVMHWHDQGRSTPEIRRLIDNEFGTAGPSTDTPSPP